MLKCGEGTSLPTPDGGPIFFYYLDFFKLSGLHLLHLYLYGLGVWSTQQRGTAGFWPPAVLSCDGVPTPNKNLCIQNKLFHSSTACDANTTEPSPRAAK